MEQKDKKMSHFNMSEDISQISIVDSSMDENQANAVAKSQSQSILRDISVNSMNSSENGNSEKMDVAEGYSEELIPPSPLPLRSVLEDLEKGAEAPKVSNSQNVVSVTDRLLKEAQKAAREKRLSSSEETNSDIEEPDTVEDEVLENEDSEGDDDDIVEHDDSIRNYIVNLGGEDLIRNHENELESEGTNKEPLDSEDIAESPIGDEDVRVDSEVLEEDVENNDTNSSAMDVNEISKENEPAEKDDTTEDTNSLQNQLPFSKIRKIIKADDENNLIVTKEAVYLASIAAELFIANITQQTAKITHANKKKTVSLAHLKSALAGSETFDFLEGCFPDIY